MDELAHQGFLRELCKRRIAADVLLADAHTGYFNNSSVVDWLKDYVSAPAHALPLTHMANAREDQFVCGRHLLPAALALKRLFTTPGGHNWRVWLRLW